MSRRRSLSMAGAAVLAACAMVGGPIAAQATASDSSIKQDLGRALPKLRHSQTQITSAFAAYKNTHSPTRLIKAVMTQDATLRGLQTELRHESASSTDGAHGRTDIVRGLGLLLQSNTKLDTLLRRHAGRSITAGELAGALARGGAGLPETSRSSRGLRGDVGDEVPGAGARPPSSSIRYGSCAVDPTRRAGSQPGGGQQEERPAPAGRAVDEPRAAADHLGEIVAGRRPAAMQGAVLVACR